MQEQPPLIALLTDFGLEDTYVGQMKAAILSITPRAQIIDLTHAVPPQDIVQGAFLLERALPVLPEGTVVVAVVDPGVGTERKAIAVESGGRIFIGPDNGLFTPILEKHEVGAAVEITERRYMRPLRSSTFHGRDIFAPAAAHAASGVPIAELGSAIMQEECRRIPMPGVRPVDGKTGWEGSVVFRDRYGNLVTSIPSELAGEEAAWRVVLSDGTAVPLLGTYGEAGEGEALAYRGSFGNLEIAVRNGSAHDRFGLGRGDLVRLERG
ncbi:SAM-dependent chlorinase/fluorinase [Chlorobium sp. N1]|uniref:SAM hydrolase/SAM-dependent halogenase family protein n=1 Tax=Chlorobium sp. N1 TaxID=2491138 RepID=UPI001039C8A4|nr:SAM-dependent chlorinase/fluorinase [Chlorobium sp. N1]TCD47562.1 hypothetical protein E0L29_06830 [Chlorobium sp. N1]